MTVGDRVVLNGSPGEGEIIHDFREGSVAVGWDGVGVRHHHVSQLSPAPAPVDRAAIIAAEREREAQAQRWEAQPDPYEPGPYTGDEPDYDGFCADYE